MLTLPGRDYGNTDRDIYRSPFDSYATNDTPLGWRNILMWCHNIFANNGTVRTALDRVVSYFLTDIDIGAVTAQDYMDDDENEKWQRQLRSMDVVGTVRRANMDMKCYGTYFVSLQVPFHRHLGCPRCGYRSAFREFTTNPRFNFRFSQFEFTGSCPVRDCKYSGKFTVIDEPDNRQDDLKFKLWPPTEIEIIYDLFTDDMEFVWRIPEDYKNQIRQGRLFQLERISKPVLEAIKTNSLYRFNKDKLFVGREMGPSGLRTRGWGFSPLLYNSRQMWYVEVLHRYNEALALDYIVPMRVITPDVKYYAPDQGFNSINLADQFKRQIGNIIRQHRKKPTGWHTLPFPVNFQQFGADANKLVPYELLGQGYDALLDALGSPSELRRGSTQIQAAPTFLRIFESQHYHMVYQNNALLAWAVRRICEVLNWEPVDARFRRVQHADDLQRQLNILQMAMGGEVSKTEALRTLGLDRRDQRRQVMEDARYDQELQARMQEEMDQVSFGQQLARGMPQGGAPGQPGQPGQDPNAQAGAQATVPPGGPMAPGTSIAALIPGESNPMTPEDMEAAAGTAAQTLLGMPASQRISELRALAKKNPAMHKMVKGKMEEYRSRARSQGGSAVLAQQFGGG